jgi:hypothetical protein
MTSPKEAFGKFGTWKHSRALLNVTVWAKGEAPIEFWGAVSFVDEDSLLIGFMNHHTHLPVPPIQFDDDCSFSMEGKILFVMRGGDHFLECEDTGKVWTPIEQERKP